jgi:hypothetical protein
MWGSENHARSTWLPGRTALGFLSLSQHAWDSEGNCKCEKDAQVVKV